MVAAQQLPALPAPWTIGMGVGLALALRFFKRRALPLFLLGFCWAMGFATARLREALPAPLENRDVLIEGRVSELPVLRDEIYRFDFEPTRTLDPVGVELPTHIRLNWRHSLAMIKADERWRLRVRLKRPHGFLNPGGMDYEGWLFAQGIRATGYVREDPENLRLSGADSLWSPNVWRQTLDDRLGSALAWSSFSGVIKALTLGNESEISQAQWQIFRRTGTAHLVAISGSHIGMIAGFVFICIRYLCAWLGLLRWPPATLAAIAGLLAAVFYSALANFAIPTQRSLIMIAIFMGSVILQRRLQAPHVLALALAAVLLYDPLAAIAPGFWLSFGAVALIALVLANRLRPFGAWPSLWRTNWATSVGLSPLLLLFFQQVSIVSPLANLVAVPIIGLIVIPLCLLGSSLLFIHDGAAYWVLTVAEHLLQIIWFLLAWLSSTSWAQWHHASPPGWTLLFALPGCILLLAPRGIPARWLGLVLLLPCLTIQPEPPRPGEFRLTLLDVGQGLASVLQTRNHTLVFDTGARWGEDFDMGGVVVEPFLRQQGLATIDTLVISHGDNDHIGGAASLIEAFAPRRILSSVIGQIAESQPEPCQAGQQWNWDEVRFEMLGPTLRLPDKNNNSCVLKVSADGGAVLLTGDIEKPAEDLLTEQYGDDLYSDIIIAPHHGSKTSSSRAFLDAVKPRYVFIPAGHLNQYHFPHEVVLQRYRDTGADFFTTGERGAITMDITRAAKPDVPDSYRISHRRYWQDEPRL